MPEETAAEESEIKVIIFSDGAGMRRYLSATFVRRQKAPCVEEPQLQDFCSETRGMKFRTRVDGKGGKK